VREPQHRQRDEHGDAVETEEQAILAPATGVATAVGERPVAVESVRDGRRGDDGDGFGGEGLVVEHPAAREHQQIEQADIDHKGDEADNAELAELTNDGAEGIE